MHATLLVCNRTVSIFALCALSYSVICSAQVEDIVADTVEQKPLLVKEYGLSSEQKSKTGSLSSFFQIVSEAVALPTLQNPHFDRLFKIIETDPTSRELLILTIAELKKAGKLQQMAPRFVEIAEKHPEAVFLNLAAVEFMNQKTKSKNEKRKESIRLLENVSQYLLKSNVLNQKKHQADPDQMEVFAVLIRLYTQEDDYEKAETLADKLLALPHFPENPEFLQAELAFRMTAYEEEASAALPFLIPLPTEKDRLLAAFNLALDRYAQATLNTNDLNINRHPIGFSILMKNEKGGVVKSLILKALISNPDDIGMLLSLAGTYTALDEPQNAVRTWQKILRLTKNAPWNFYSRYAEALKNAGQPEKALTVYELALLVSPDNPRVLSAIIRLQMDLQDYKKALAKLKKMPDSFEKYYLSAMIHNDMQQPAEAIRQIRLADKASEKVQGIDRKALKMLEATYAEKNKDLPLVETIMRALIAKHPDDPDLKNFLGYVFADHNMKLDEAENLLKEALNSASDRSEICDSYAWLLYRKKQYREALLWIQKSIRLAGESLDGVIADHAGDIYEALGDIPNALKYWEIANESPSRELNKNKIMEKISKYDKK